MAMPAKLRYVADDIWDAPDDGNRYEVINGQLVVTPAPSWDHQEAVTELASVLRVHTRTLRMGRVVVAPVGVVLGPEHGFEPDIVYVSNERSDVISRRGVHGAPDLVVEALSPSTERRDRGAKLRAYAEAGVPHYWILDVARWALEIYELSANGYELTATYHVGDVFEPKLFPGLASRISDLFE